MNVRNLAIAIGALRVVLLDYGIDERTQDDVVEKFSRRLIEEEFASVLSLPHLKEESHASNH